MWPAVEGGLFCAGVFEGLAMDASSSSGMSSLHEVEVRKANGMLHSRPVRAAYSSGLLDIPTTGKQFRPVWPTLLARNYSIKSIF